MTIPKDKAKLRSSGMLRMCMLSSHSSLEDITLTISRSFGKKVIVLLATKSGELFDAPADISGERLLDIIGNSYLNVRSAISPQPALPPPFDDPSSQSCQPEMIEQGVYFNFLL